MRHLFAWRLAEKHFESFPPSSLMGHSRKVFNPRCWTSSIDDFLSRRALSTWNAPPEEIIKSAGKYIEKLDFNLEIFHWSSAKFRPNQQWAMILSPYWLTTAFLVYPVTLNDCCTVVAIHPPYSALVALCHPTRDRPRKNNFLELNFRGASGGMNQRVDVWHGPKAETVISWVLHCVLLSNEVCVQPSRCCCKER